MGDGGNRDGARCRSGLVRDSGSHNPSGSFADLTKAPVNRVVGECAKCGAGLPRKNKKFCSPCYDIRYAENLARNRAKQKALRDGK